MRDVNISVHSYAGLRKDLTFRQEDIRIAYSAAGIALHFQPGQVFAGDPLYGVGYQGLLKQLSQMGTKSGHLVIGGRYPGLDPTLSGELLDVEQRGFCAVYTLSQYITDHGVPALLQCCAHEIGHMLNLGHMDNAPYLGADQPAYMTTMDQMSDRTLVPEQIAGAWALASKEASRQRQQSVEPYFYPQAAPTACLPLGLTARTRLNTLADTSLFPWGGRFEQGQIIET